MGYTVMDNIGSNIVGGLLIFSVILIVIFLVCREIICWYWKINQNVALLTEIRDLLAAKGTSSTSPNVANPSPAAEIAKAASAAKLDEEQRAYAMKPKGSCPNCKAIIPLDSESCPKCKAQFGPGAAWQIRPSQ